MKVPTPLRLGLLCGVAILFSSCSTNFDPAPAVSDGSAGAFHDGELVLQSPPAPVTAATKAPKARPGIATGWGRVVESELGYRNFVRSSGTPKAVSIIRYNDEAGAKAMGLKRHTKGNGMQQAGNGLVEWGMSTGFTMLDNYWWRKGRFVIGKEGREYQIQVKNLSDARLEVVLSVDGLDVMDGKSASVKKRGYLIEPGKKLTVKGFRTSGNRVATFKFSTVEASYANLRHGKTRNVGVVGLALFTEKGREPGAEGQRREEARAFAEAPPVRGR